MASHRVYLRKEQEKEIQEAADRLGVEVSELIKIRLETARTINERLTRLEVSYNVLFQKLSIVLSDTSWLRGLLEVQGAHNEQANKRATDLENHRQSIAKELYEKGEELKHESAELGAGTHL